MKVLLVHNDYQQAGGERTSVDALEALLRESGCGVTRYGRDNAEITKYTLRDKLLFFLRTIYSKRTVSELKAIVREKRPDVAHVHNVFPLISPSAYRVLSQLAVPIVQTLHNFRFLCPNGNFFTHGSVCERCKFGNTLHAVRFRCYHESRLLSLLYATTIAIHRQLGTFDRIDRFLALSDFSASKFVESGLVKGDKVTVLSSFLPEPLPIAGSLSHREPYVVYLGRLSEEKGIITLIDAMVGLSSLRLKVLGTGPLLSQLTERINTERIENVDMLGFVAGEPKWNLLRRATAVIIPSVCYENLPFSVLEALSVGTPVVVSNRGSLPQLIDGGSVGMQFRSGDAADLRDRLLWLASHDADVLAMGRRARATVERTRSPDAYFTRLQLVYSNVMGR